MVVRKGGSLEPVEAFTVIVLFAALADGNVEQEEMDIICNVLSRMNAFRRYRSDIRQLLAKTVVYVRSNPQQALADAILSMAKDLQETAFAVAVDIIMSDGNVSDTEMATIDVLANTLSVSKTKVNKIIEVMAIKNRG